MGVPPLHPATLEALCGVLGETSGGLSGSEIGSLLHQCGIADLDPSMTKRVRLLDALGARQAQDGVANHVLRFVEAAMHPARYVGRSTAFHERQARLNAVLSLAGLRVNDEGRTEAAAPTRTASQAEQRAGRLRAELVRRQVHPAVLAACRAELLQENYFHAVLEASKSVAERVREISGLTADGAELVDVAFSFVDRERRFKDPVLALNSLHTLSEQSEQRGVMHLMKGIFALFRNPTAHELKTRWAVDEREALDLLTMVSVVHRKLESAVRVRRKGAPQ